MASNKGLFRVLKTPCRVSQAWNGLDEAPPAQDFTAIWDTGATHVVITQAVIDACGLAPTGMTRVYDARGDSLCETFLVSIWLPNNVRFQAVSATKGILSGADMLIGMEIIAQGDFAVTNFNGDTKFSFRIPSLRHIDFVEEHSREATTPRFTHGGSRGSRPKRAAAPRSKKKRK